VSARTLDCADGKNRVDGKNCPQGKRGRAWMSADVRTSGR
jgi:hypothetical protein